MSAYSPSPWRWENTPGAGLQVFAPIPFKADCVEFVLKAAEQPIYTLVAYEKWLQFPPLEWATMQEANARLIAAAPELLEACKQAEKAIEELPPRVGENRFEPLIQLRAAIAKATGGAQ